MDGKDPQGGSDEFRHRRTRHHGLCGPLPRRTGDRDPPLLGRSHARGWGPRAGEPPDPHDRTDGGNRRPGRFQIRGGGQITDDLARGVLLRKPGRVLCPLSQEGGIRRCRGVRPGRPAQLRSGNGRKGRDTGWGLPLGEERVRGEGRAAGSTRREGPLRHHGTGRREPVPQRDPDDRPRGERNRRVRCGPRVEEPQGHRRCRNRKAGRGQTEGTHRAQPAQHKDERARNPADAHAQEADPVCGQGPLLSMRHGLPAGRLPDGLRKGSGPQVPVPDLLHALRLHAAGRRRRHDRGRHGPLQ